MTGRQQQAGRADQVTVADQALTRVVTDEQAEYVVPWVLLFRGRMDEDPVWGALKEPTTYLCGGLWGLALFLAT